MPEVLNSFLWLCEILSGDNRDTLTNREERDEEEMLRRAIAMSLQGEEEVTVSIKGELLKQTRKPRSYASSKLKPTAPVTVGGEVYSY